MSENRRRRMSKWDVVDDPQVLGPTRRESEIEVLGDTRFQETDIKSEQNSLAHDKEHFCMHADKKDENFMENKIHEADGLRSSSSLVESIRPSHDTFNKAHLTKQSDFGTEKPLNQSVSTGSKRSEINAEADFQSNGTFRKRTDDRRQQGGDFLPRGGRSSSRRKSRSGSRSRSWSWSWSRSRSRSRSPISLKHESGAWSNRGRTRTGQPPACRDFVGGHCRRGSHCRFLHDGRHRMSDRPYNEHLRERRFERAGSSGHDSKEKLGVSRNQADDYIRDKPFQRYGNSYNESNLDDPELFKDNKSAELCLDFTKGRCQRGSSCRYLHHEPSLPSERSVDDDARERSHDRRDQDSLYSRKFEPRRANDVPCKFFADGLCSRGKSCRFSHHEVHDGPQDVYREGNDGLLRNASNWDNQAMNFDIRNPSKCYTNNSDISGASSQFIKEQNYNQNSQHMQSEAVESGLENRLQDVSNRHLSSQVHGEASLHDPAVPAQMLVSNAHLQQQSGTRKISVQESVVSLDNSAESQVNINSDNNVLSLPPVRPAQSLAKSGQAQFVVSQRQSIIPIAQVSHIVAPLPGPIRQTSYPISPTGLNQLTIPLNPANPQNFNLQMQNPSIPHPVHIGQTQQKSDSGLQLQQNASLVHKGLSRQDLNLNDFNSQFGAPPMHGQIQQNLNNSIEIPHQGLFPFQAGQGQRIVQSCSFETQNASESSSVVQPLKPDSHQINSHIISVDASKEIMDTSEANLSSHISDNIVPGKIVSSEQAKKITNLSASLALFFGNAALSATTSGMPQQPVSNANAAMLAPATTPSIHLSQGFGTKQLPDPLLNHLRMVKPETSNLPSGLPLKSELANVMQQTSSISSFQMPVTDGTKPYTNEVQPSLGILPAKGNESEDTNDNETKTNLNDVEANDQAEEDSKQNKDAKAMRAFKCALVEFVKDILKPVWKEGQLSKEAHKTIVKKVVEKVTSAMQGPNLPRTQEKIDLYLAHSKPKLSKLVQAYVEKYVKN